MIYLLTGLPGNGKSYFTVAKGPELLAHPGRTIYHNGIPELKLPWELCDASTWYNLPDGSAVVVDEAQQIFRPLPAGADRPRNVRDLETHRHRGFDLWLITQHPNLIDSHVRRLVGKHYHVHRPFGLGRFNVWAWEKAEDPDDYHAQKRAVKSHVAFDPKIFALYKSAEIHTVKRRLPWKLFLLPVLVAAVGILAWFGYSTLKGSTETKKAKQATAAPGVISPEIQQASIRRTQRQESFVPDVPELPHTAPRYDAQTRVKAVPVVRGCMQDLRYIPPTCWCVSQRGTRMDVTKEFCLSVIERGRPFYDFESDDRDQVATAQMPGRPPDMLPIAQPGASSSPSPLGTIPLPTR